MSFFRNIFRALSSMERRALWIAVACVVIGAAGLAVFIFKNHTAIVPAYRGTYTEGAVGQPSYVNPALAASDVDQGLVRLIFADLEDLSDSMETSADGRNIKVHLKQGIEWSDGEELTSDDVIFTLKGIQNPDARSPLAGLFQGVTAERLSALEIDFRLENVSLGYTIADLRPVPQHLYEDIPPANWRLSEYNLRPVASGPYVFTSRATAADGFITEYHMAANSRYAGTKPYLQKVDHLFFRNVDELLTAFNGGHIQGFATTDSSLMDKIQRPYALAQFTTPTVYAVFWNSTANPALEAFEARWALDLSIDRNKVIEAMGGYAEKATGPFPPSLLPPVASGTTASGTATSSATNSTSTDPVNIMERNGWRKADDGIWTKSIARADVRLSLALTVPDIAFLKSAAESVVEQWRTFGADARLNVLPPTEALSDAITNRNYEGLLFGNTVRGTGDLYPFWHSSGRFAPGLNLAIYRDARVDTLLEGLRLKNNASEREQDMRRVSAFIVDAEAAAFLFSGNNLYVASKNVQNVSEGFLQNPADRLKQLPQWYVGTTRRFR